jgi:DnaJ homolog subfamily A member 2
MFFGGGNPFEQFEGSGSGRRSARPVDNNKLYEVLGVAKDADENEIRKAYKKLALKNHPDKGGDIEKVCAVFVFDFLFVFMFCNILYVISQFKEISAAAEVLCDADKRKIYDQHGLEGLEGSGGEHHSADDIFSMFFGGGGTGRRSGPQKGEDIVHNIKASLEDLYNGKTVRLAISRNKPCQDCEGRGGSPGAEKTCSDCSGRGSSFAIGLSTLYSNSVLLSSMERCSRCASTNRTRDGPTNANEL